MSDIPNTGERILLEKETPAMIARHLCAYHFAQEITRGTSVLDVGCGQGYGSNILARQAHHVTGIDYNQDAIEYAQSTYTRDNLTFARCDVNELPTLGKRFDCICCFQVIEHLRDTGLFLSNIKQLLQPQGTFICSTPNRLDASGSSVTPLNKFHVKEYLIDEFKQILEDFFENVAVVGLKRSRRFNTYRRIKKVGVFNFLPARFDPVQKYYNRINCDEYIFVQKGLETALDFIAVCKAPGR